MNLLLAVRRGPSCTAVSVRTALCAAALTTGLLVAGCDVQVGDKGLSFDLAQGKATEEWVRTYTLPPGGRLEIINVNGPIQVAPSTTSKVEVRAAREARAGSDDAARQLLAASRMVEEVAPNHVKVEVPRPDGASGFRRSVSVKYDVRLPPGLTVSLRTQNGAVQMENVRGTITASTTNGGIIGRDLAGVISANTVNGGVQLSFADVTGDVEARTVNGGVRLELPPDTNAQVDASAVNGGVSVDDALKLTGAEQDARHVSGTLNKGGPKISAQTTNGGVRIYTSGRAISGRRGR